MHMYDRYIHSQADQYWESYNGEHYCFLCNKQKDPIELVESDDITNIYIKTRVQSISCDLEDRYVCDDCLTNEEENLDKIIQKSIYKYYINQ